MGAGLAGAPQEEAGHTRTFETSHVCGATCRTSPIPRSALEKNPMMDPSSKATLWVPSFQCELSEPNPKFAVSAHPRVPRSLSLSFETPAPAPAQTHTHPNTHTHTHARTVVYYTRWHLGPSLRGRSRSQALLGLPCFPENAALVKKVA